MPNIASLPDEIVQHLLQSIHNTGDEDFEIREIAFLNLVEVFPQWIPILLDARFMNDAGQLGPRYEDVWGFRNRVYLDEESGLWKIRDEKWQPQGAKINARQTRSGDSSHVEVKEEEEIKPPIRRRDGQRNVQAKARRMEAQWQGDPEDPGYDSQASQSSSSSFEGWVLRQI